MTPETPSCAACGGPTRALWPLPAGPAVRCIAADCGLAFIHPQPDEDALAAAYRRHYFPADRGEFSGVDRPPSLAAREQVHFEWLDRELGLSDKRLLDFGCGVGPFLDAARGRCAAAEGIEPDATARATAESRGHDVVAALADAPVGEWNLVYMNDVFEHLRDPVATCSELAARLRPGGAMFVSTIDLGGLKARLRGPDWDMMTDPTHLFFPTRGALTRMLHEAGLAEVREVRIPFSYAHHDPARRVAQAALVRLGLDSTLKMLCRK